MTRISTAKALHINGVSANRAVCNGVTAWNRFDADAWAYILAVEAKDGQRLEHGVRLALNNLFVGLKADGDFAKLKAACILGAARTLAGSLEVSLVPSGPLPTNFGFVAGDRTRVGGLKGDASSKYLLANRTSNEDSQNNNHYLTHFTEADTTASALYFGAGGSGLTQIHYGYHSATQLVVRSKSNSVDLITTSGVRTGLIGVSRNNSANYSFYHSNTTNTVTRASEPPGTAYNLAIFGRNTVGTVTSFSNGRILLYSIGEAVSSNFRVRLNTFAAALAAALV